MSDAPPLRESATPPIFLTIGADRVWCVGCKQWVPTEGFCEGDPDICPVGEEPDQARAFTPAEAQEAVEALAAELRALDELGAARLPGETATEHEVKASALRLLSGAGTKDDRRAVRRWASGGSGDTEAIASKYVPR